MLPYYAKRIESAELGGRIVYVECEKCGCEYCYKLTRIGTGGATAHYGIGEAFATREAEIQSLEDLEQRLNLEAELVPCPNCNWINNELVEGYRLGRYRRVGIFALGVGLFGTIGSLICAWFVSVGPAIDRVALPYFLFGGPALSVILAIGMIALRKFLRSRIQPNRKFPLAPCLPAATPPTLLVDNLTGKLTPVNSRLHQNSFSDDLLDFQIGRHDFPSQCCDCLQAAEIGHSFKQPISSTIDLYIPRCANCDAISKRKFWRIWKVIVIIGLLIGVVVSMPLNLRPEEFWILIFTALLLAIAVAKFIASIATVPVRVAGKDLSRGVVRLRFRSICYGRLVAQHLDES